MEHFYKHNYIIVIGNLKVHLNVEIITYRDEISNKFYHKKSFSSKIHYTLQTYFKKKKKNSLKLNECCTDKSIIKISIMKKKHCLKE